MSADPFLSEIIDARMRAEETDFAAYRGLLNKAVTAGGRLAPADVKRLDALMYELDLPPDVVDRQFKGLVRIKELESVAAGLTALRAEHAGAEQALNDHRGRVRSQLDRLKADQRTLSSHVSVGELDKIAAEREEVERAGNRTAAVLEENVRAARARLREAGTADQELEQLRCKYGRLELPEEGGAADDGAGQPAVAMTASK